MSPEARVNPEGGEKLRGRVRRITFHNPENGYTVARLEVAGQPGLVTLVGAMPGVSEGHELEITGRRSEHPKFGPQWEVVNWQIVPPSDEEGVKRYLASGLVKGIGPVLAERVVETLGPTAVDQIMADSRALARVPGIGRKKAASITASLREHGQLRELMIFLQGHGVPSGTALRIWRTYGAGSLSVLREEPHRLAADITGIGFVTADQIAAKLGIAHDHPTRLRAGLIYMLRESQDEGHVFLPYEELMETTARELRVGRELLGPAFARLHNQGRLVLQEEGETRLVYLPGLWRAESRAASDLARLTATPGLLPPERARAATAWVSRQLAFAPSESQAQALTSLLEAGLGVLTGGPGTGKTTLVQAIIAVAQRMGLTVSLAAPTGRAARRLAETTGLEAQTLHRLLEYTPKDNSFARNEENPLASDLVVVDESSMIDIWLGSQLCRAVGPGTRLILVGDADQLPPVGPGLFFRQIMDSGRVPVARLREIFRQNEAGLIVQNAHRVLEGLMPLQPPRGADTADFYFIEERDPARGAEVIRELVVERLPRRFGFDPLEDIQVLSPMYRGNLGCSHLNQLLRQALNPAAGDRQSLWTGDKVMQSRNNYDLDVFNGDVGRVREAGPDGLTVRLDQRLVDFGPAEAQDLLLAFAITVHKAQGSEYPAVVLALGQEHYVMLNRPLLYTAMTRGRNLVVIVGQGTALQRAVDHVEPIRRHARLDVLLAREVGEG
ncbi:MAG: ATP-dependent RecD-like DNA helicase [Deltaproteobacteria bacterium]|nr:ATP-dependent RecD-like DNA helicase [Deltaproteobacteria bacterium]